MDITFILCLFERFSRFILREYSKRLGDSHMIIKKILNNNAIVTNNESGREIIAVGKGIAFNHKNGDKISNDVVQKTYTLSNPDVLDKFGQLIASISIEYVQVANEIIELAERELECKFNDTIYISLTDHIHMLVNRIRKGLSINNVMLLEIYKFYEREFLVAQRAINLINARFQVNIPEDEAGFIAIHFVDSQIDSNTPIANKMMKMIQEIVNIVRMTCQIEFDKQSFEYYRFVTHLKFFVKRVLNGQQAKKEIEDEVSAAVKNKYVKATECAEKIALLIEQNYHYRVSADEKLYLTIHISKFIYQKLNQL